MLKNKKAIAKELSGLKEHLKNLSDYGCGCEKCQRFRSVLCDFKKSELQEIIVVYLRNALDLNLSQENKKFSSYIG